MKREALIELTHNCTLACSHCFVNRNKEELSKEDYFEIFSKLKELGVEDVILMGGEPTLHKNFSEILSYCVHLFETVIVETNGTTKTEFFKYPSCNVAISLEYPSKIRNDRIRKFVKGRRSPFEFALRKIKTIHNPKTIRFTLYQDSIVFTSLVMADMYGCNSIFFPLIPTGSGRQLSKNCPNPHKIAETLNTIAEFNLKSKYHHELALPQNYIHNKNLYLKFSDNFKKRGRICQAGERRIYVNVRGEVFPCPFVPKKLGNILVDNINFIKKEILKFNKDIKNKKPKFPCDKCFFYSVCGGGCCAYHYNRKYKCQENCPVNFLIKKYIKEVKT
jgi:radical SAM protein with 4Fe4S-binding SPASM domain